MHRLCSGLGSIEELFERLRAKAKRHGVLAQIFDPKAVVSERQLLMAYWLARRAFIEKRNIARTMETEILLRCAGTRMIDEAVRAVGAKSPSDFLLLTDASGSALRELLTETDSKERRIEFTMDESRVERLARLYDIDIGLLRSYPLEDLVLERMALLEAEK